MITVFVNVPANDGCSDCVATALKFKALVTFEIIAVALELKFPNLSTALIKYVPVLAGTEIDVAGRDTFSTNATEFCQSAVPSVASENLKL